MFVGHGESVDGAPVGEIRLAIEGARLSRGFVFLAENVSGLGIDVPAHPRDGATDIEDGGVDVADLLSARGGKGERRIIDVLGDIDQIVMKLREHLVFLRGRHTARAHACHAHEGVIGGSDDGERALRGLYVDVHAVGKGKGDIHRTRRATAVALGDVHVNRFDRL